MPIANAVKRLLSQPGKTCTYALCRFQVCRSIAKKFANGAAPATLTGDGEELFEDLNVSTVLNDLEQTGLYFGPNLSSSMVKEIRDFAETGVSWGYSNQEYVELTYPEVREVERRTGGRMLMAYLKDPAERCSAIGQLCKDPKLLEIAMRYIGGFPKSIRPRLWWSVAGDATVEERLKANQTVLFHYDLEGFQFLYFNFYISEVDQSTGPHVAVLGTHRRKKLGHLLGSATRSDDEVQSTYGKENVLTITGPPGYGFIEDTFCFHKATAPTTKDRLMLQIRMSY
jgi:hypothetical protein